MAKTKKPFMLNTFNTFTQTMLRIGVRVGHMSLVTIRGRKSGEPRTTTLWITERNGQRWVISPYGQTQWVRNLRAAGEATLRRGRHTEHVSATEMSPKEGGPLILHSLDDMPSFLRAYFDVTKDSSGEEFEREVLKHPMFRFEKKSA